MRLARPLLPRGGMKGPDWPGLTAMEETMQTLSISFNLAAAGNADIGTDLHILWLVILIIAIMDERDRRARKRRKDSCAKPRPGGPRPF